MVQLEFVALYENIVNKYLNGEMNKYSFTPKKMPHKFIKGIGAMEVSEEDNEEVLVQNPENYFNKKIPLNELLQLCYVMAVNYMSWIKHEKGYNDTSKLFAEEYYYLLDELSEKLPNLYAFLD